MKYLVIAALLFGPLAHALDMKDEIFYTNSVESNESQSGFLNYTHFTKERFQVEVGFGSSRNKSDLEKVTSRSFIFGVSSDPLANWQVGGYLESWGLKDELQEHKVRLPFLYNFEDWTVRTALSLGTLSFQNITGETDDVKVSSNAFELGVMYFGLKNWSFSFDAASHSYGRDLTDFSNDRVASFYSESTLNLTGGLLQSRGRLGATRSLGNFDVGIGIGSTKSAIDESVTGFFEVMGSYELKKTWVFGVTLGRAKVSDYGLIPLADQDDEPFGYADLNIGFMF